MRLVIDANIAHSAGSSEVPSSLYSRECLNAVLNNDHIAVFNSSLRGEWKAHASLFAKRWWRSMAARRRIDDVEGEEFAAHLAPACAYLEEDGWKAALRKDFHLVQSALASDWTILSNERSFPKYVALASRKVRVLSTLYFANPEVEGSPCIVWIKAGADAEAKRHFDVWVASH